ncbi:signal recognition particle-docking protein FtsY [Aestuariimicrobium sp. T2.26MG-19.2B]|uniref:signal recognition particle-docking protein FtsY n=1 Tax=Aestuariimicrobium sp. T2.26MG-19.2B TaxID=3040679 RepID=UPI0024779196|nr:signal recognition particle-docking protein FtsY [Aestuariimicrobium sp. T2.26MG-19.2B]CAI9398744.1 Signal recognition particle receptor FtsY [Aestuariimicrobium sp. T2.26MG-19.2B]
MPTDLTFIFWIILGVVLAATAVGIVVALRERRQLPPVVPTPEVEAPEAEPETRPAPPTVEAPTEEAPPVEAPTAATSAPELETIEAPTSRLARLRRRLATSNNALARGLADLLSRDRIDDETWDDFEMTLISSDLGVGPTTELTTHLRQAMAIDGVADPAQAKATLRRELVRLVDPTLDRTLHVEGADGNPGVVMVVGVNGTGKTTTVGKLARVLVAEQKTVLLGAADTFRAAAAEQLTTWGERVGVETVRGPEGADPASVAFDAVAQGVNAGVDTVIVDTAGRLHTKTGLMDELGKVKRVIEKKAPVTEVLLVLDATTGQNGLVQARIFAEVVDVTGIVLTKLDGSAKGGIVVQVQRELKVPVKLIGLGEGADDLAPFEAEGFVAGLLGE